MQRRALALALSLFLLSTTTATAYDENGNYAVWGIGKNSCFRYMKARENNDYEAYTNYIKGFLTAYNIIEKETYNITANKSFNEILEWLDDECELKQINPLEQALIGLIDENYEKRWKKAKKQGGR